MTKSLENKRVAILATNGFEQSELFHPLNALKYANVKVDIISLEKGAIKGWDEDNWGESIEVDLTLQEAKSEEYDALILPGGLFNPDTLRTSDAAIAFIKDFFADEKQRPVAAVCHGPWLLIEAGIVKGRNLTSYPSIQTDLRNAGANWQDAQVLIDGQIITSRNPDDLPAFSEQIIKALSQ